MEGHVTGYRRVLGAKVPLAVGATATFDGHGADR